jgi:FAD/FMN-containing dehydrogenase
VGTLASIRAFLERRALSVCLVSWVVVVGGLTSILGSGLGSAQYGDWVLGWAAVQALGIYGACWVILVGACTRGYPSARCQLCCVILVLGPVLVLALLSQGRVW